MGMFDRYYVSQDFKCPKCGSLKSCKDFDFQTKELPQPGLISYRLGDKIQYLHDTVNFYAWCKPADFDLDLDKNEIIKNEEKDCNIRFSCHVYLDKSKNAIKEVITAYNPELKEDALIYEKHIDK